MPSLRVRRRGDLAVRRGLIQDDGGLGRCKAMYVYPRFVAIENTTPLNSRFDTAELVFQGTEPIE